jgi:hypothetical protein
MDTREKSAGPMSRSWKRNERSHGAERNVFCSARVRLKIPCDASILAALLGLPWVLFTHKSTRIAYKLS